MNPFQDVRHALRLMAKHRGFTAVALTVLALGIGANSALFSVLNTVLLRPLPYEEPHRLLQLGRSLPMGQSNAVSPSQFLYWQEHNAAFQSMATYEGRGGGLNLVEGDRPERVPSLGISANFFRVLGVPPQVGRDFVAADGEPGAAKVALISDGLWRRRFGADPSVVGRSLRWSGEQRTVVGVMPRGFDFINRADVWTPLTLTFDPQDSAIVYYVIARLEDGVTAEAARSDMAGVAKALRAGYPDLVREGEGIFVLPYLDQVVGDVRPALLILLGAVGLVLLIACANVANLLLARANSRRREMALRASLGAGRGQIVRQLLTESLLLALAGGALGLLVAEGAVAAVVRLQPESLPRLGGIAIDGPVMAFTLGVSLLTGVLFGLVPAFQASRVDLQEALKAGGSGGGEGVRQGRGRRALVVAEVALALVLLVGATLLLNSLANVTGLDPGYDYQQVLTMKMSPGRTEGLTTGELTRFVDEVVERLEGKPGIEAAATISTLPLEHGLMSFFDVEGRDRPDATEREGRAQWRLISDDYFRAMGIPLLRGRAFSRQDHFDAPPVIVINEALAERYFPGEDPVGQALVTGDGAGSTPPDRIVGVVGNVLELTLDQPPTPTIYAAARQAPDGVTAFLAALFPTSWAIRTTGDPLDPMAYGALVREEILAVDPEQPVSNLRSMEALMASSIADRRLSTLLLSLFAGLALLLAVVGLYGLMAYAVTRRTREVGVRLALGATARDALRLILGEGMRLTVIGIGIGLVAALGCSRLLVALLYDTAPTHPGVFLSASLALLASAGIACLIPALRATRVDPVIALRDE